MKSKNCKLGSQATRGTLVTQSCKTTCAPIVKQFRDSVPQLKIYLFSLLFLSLLVFSSGGVRAVVTITQGAGSIALTGSGNINISSINSTLHNTTVLSNVGNNWTLNFPINSTTSSITVELTDADIGILYLNKSSNLDLQTVVIAKNIKITSWNGTSPNLNSNRGNYLLFGQSVVNGHIIDNVSFLYLGNSTSNKNGLDIRGKNFTIINSNFTNNYVGIKLITGSANNENLTISNNVFFNNSFAQISLSSFNYNGTLINNNSFYTFNISGPISGYGIYNFNGLTPLNITNNYFDSYTRNIYFSNTISNNGYSQVLNNTFFFDNASDNARYGTRAIDIDRSNFMNFTNNRCFNQAICFRIYASSDNVIIANNYIFNNDWSLDASDVSNLSILNNVFFNNTMSYDTYNMGIGSLRNVTSALIDGNNITNILSQGIHVHLSRNIVVSNNYFSFIQSSEELNYGADGTNGAHDSGYLRTAIQLTPSYRSWLNDAIYLNDTQYASYKSDNVTLINNSFDSNTPVYLWDIGTTNLTSDITNYRYLKIHAPTYFEYPSQIYFNPSILNITSSDRVGNSVVTTLTNNIAYGHQHGNTPQNGNRVYFNFLFPDFVRVTNVNATSLFNNTLDNSGIYTVAFYNLSNALIYHNNLSVIGSTDLVNNIGNINGTIKPNENLTLLDNYQVTETPRANDPISFTSSSPTQKVINSSLVDSINATVVAQFGNCDVSKFTLTQGGQVTNINSGFSCSGGVYTFNQLQINSGDNFLESTQYCVFGEVIGYTIIMIVFSAGLLFLCFYILKGDTDMSNMEFSNVTLKTLIMVFFLIILGVAFLTSISNTIAARCVL